MFCPRCGTENDRDDRYCVNCGSELKGRAAAEGSPQPSPAERLSRLVGSSPRARVVSAATAAAVIVAVVAFIALKPSSDETVTQDAYLHRLDRSCVAEKERVSQLELETLRVRPPDLGEFASVLVTIVAEWRAAMLEPPAPPAHQAGVAEFRQALLGLLIEAGKLARLSREAAPAAAIGRQLASTEAATEAVDAAIAGLGLERCAATSAAARA